MDKTQQGSDRNTPSVGSLNPVKLPKSDAERKPTDSEKLKEQPFTVKDERGVSPIVPTNAPSPSPVSDGAGQSHPLDANVDGGPLHPTQMYAPEAHGFYYGGYGNTSREWDEYPYAHSEGMEMGSPGIYNENHSLMFHTGYGYSPQMPYGPYSPATTPVPTIRGDGQFYSTQQYPYTVPYYQQHVPPGMAYISSTPLSPVDSSLPFGMEQQGVFLSEPSTSNNLIFGPRPGYPFLYESVGRGNFAESSGNTGFYDLQHGIDGLGYGMPCSDWSKPLDLQRSLTPLISPALSPQPVNSVGPFGHNAVSSAPGMNQRSSYGFGSSPNSFSGDYPHARMYQQGTAYVPPFASFGIARGDSWRGGRGSNSLCNCNSILDDVFTEQNKGPRATKPKTLNTDQNLSADNGIISSASGPDRELYNRQDFITEYKDARFFIIKSYSEDNVHKSIKYGVWASTPNGNKKLDSAYGESREKGGCPVFLLFSVNASAQFCGVAEMIGPVDFDRSVDYWQQDKWSGQFPVKWHIIKDVPNGQFRHIVLENNDNKPVTNSRDTQEVKLEQGMEMLSIFKNYESDVSIIDDFDFYEERQKIMQERKSKLTKSPVPPPTSPYQNSTLPSNPVINQMSKTFANTLQLEENKKDQ